jgi:hypothetical protein
MDDAGLFLELCWQVLNGLAPAATLAFLLGLADVVKKPSRPWVRSTWWRLGLNFGVGAGVWVGGLVLLGRDGMMATYAALVVGMATSQWVLTGAWR